MLRSLQQLLTGLVDYAGLFPPAQLSLNEAMAEYNSVQSSPYSWLGDRFVLPAARLEEFATHLATFPPHQTWQLSVILSQDWKSDLEQVHRAEAELIPKDNGQFLISTLEVAPLDPSDIHSVGAHLPPGKETFFEIPFQVGLAPYLEALQQLGAAAKLRTGGVSSSAFPDTAQLSQRILSLAQARVPFKATAGLHHPLPGNYRLTYEPNSAVGTMHGFLNVAVLAALAYQQALPLDGAVALLTETSITPFQFSETGLGWRDRTLSLEDIGVARQQFFRSLGSCSLQEPIADLKTLHLL